MTRFKKIAEVIKPKTRVAFVVTLLALGGISLAVQDSQAVQVDPQDQGAYALEPVLPMPAQASCPNTACGAVGQCFSDSLPMYCRSYGDTCTEHRCYAP